MPCPAKTQHRLHRLMLRTARLLLLLPRPLLLQKQLKLLTVHRLLLQVRTQHRLPKLTPLLVRMPLRPPRLQQVPKQVKLLRPRPLPQPRPAKHLLLRPRLSRARVMPVLPHHRPTIVSSRHSRARQLLLVHSLLQPLRHQKLPVVLRLH